MKFPVLEPLRHNGKRYAPGTDIELDEAADVALLLHLVGEGVIRDVRPILPPGGGQKSAASGTAGSGDDAGGAAAASGESGKAGDAPAANPTGANTSLPIVKPTVKAAAKKTAAKAKGK